MVKLQQIMGCESQLLQAIKNSNIKMLDGLLNDDLVFKIPTGQTITKAMDI